MKTFEIEYADKESGEVDRWVVRSCRVAQRIARDLAKDGTKRVTLRLRRQPAERQSVWLFRLATRELVCIERGTKRKVAIESLRAFDSRSNDSVMILWPEWAEELGEALQAANGLDG